MIQRAFRYRLYPTDEQGAKLAQYAGATRFVYNLAWEQRRDYWRQFRARTGGFLNYASQGRQLTELRREVDWLRGVPCSPLHQSLRDLDRAFAAFFAGRSRYPSPRRRGANDSFRFQARDAKLTSINRRWAAVFIPKLGHVKVRLSRPVAGTPVSVTVARHGEQWFVAFACEIEHSAEPSVLPPVGIDRGIANTLALSSGEMLSTPSILHLEHRKRRAQRVLARRQRGSARYRKQRQRVCRLAANMGRVRADWRHKATLNIARHFGTVAIEALKIQNMTAKGTRGLNRSILEQGWGAFERVLAYKLEERGGALIRVNPAYTSQICSSCGTIDKASRESQSSYACRHCGFAGHADTNAAMNILRRGTAFKRVEDARLRLRRNANSQPRRIGEGMPITQGGNTNG